MTLSRVVSRDFDSQLEILACHARHAPDRVAFSFLDENITFGELWCSIEAFAGGLLERGLSRGDRVVMAQPNGPGFFTAFYGAQRAGAIAVPVAPESGVARIADLAELCDAAAIAVADDLDHRAVQSLAGFLGNARALFTVSEGMAARPAPPVEIQAEDIALLQYTSGSTGDPKGVQLTHTGLITNMSQMIVGMGITEDDIFVSWLPAHHDMGLILMTMVPMALAARMVLMPTSVRSIRGWLETIADHRATFTAAPDFAYRLALRFLADRNDLDLSTLRVALNAAEPVRAGTVKAFEEAFGLSNVMCPAYGLAEATVGVSMWGPGETILADERGCVSIGRPFPDVEVRIETDDGVAAPGEVGEIVVQSPANTRGYWNNQEATDALLTADGAIRTGDLGYLDSDGHLFMVTRLKNIIIQAGRNIAPREVEEAVEVFDYVRRAAAVGIDRGGAEGEQMYVFVEPMPERANDAGSYQNVVVDVVTAVRDRLGMRPGRVYLLKTRSIPMTANGKLRYPALRDAYTDGSLREEGKILFPPY
jgi:acyl-CoA synthetase (AMP-forming)/AMP-acid ligase II